MVEETQQSIEKSKEDAKEFSQSEKAKKGWMFSVYFLVFVICLILFLSLFPINTDNRDIVVSIIGTLIGSIGAMVAVASGRDPAEIEELQAKLAHCNSDRQALISRLRDSQIQLQILRDQVSDLQNAMINKLSIFKDGDIPEKRQPEEVVLNDDVEKWLQKDEKDC